MIRAANLDDAEAIARIHVRGWQAAYAQVLPQTYLASLSIGQRTAYWRKNLQSNRGGKFVYLAEGELVGWIDRGPSRDADHADESEVYAIYVAPEYLRRGAGTALMQHAEEEIFARGITRISLWVLEQNRPARLFYEHRGYADDGTRKEVEIGGATLVETRYAKRKPA